MGREGFFSFGSKFASPKVQAPAEGLKIDENDVSDHSKLIKGQYDGINFPVVFKQKYGEKFNDILDTGWVNLFLISDRMKKILEENKLTGWRTFPIRLYNPEGVEVPGYHGFSVIGRSSPTNYERSEIIEKQKIPNGPVSLYYKGVSVDTWDGADFFTPDQTYQIFITKKAADVLKKNKITNFQLESLAEKETAVHHVKKNMND